MARRTYTQDFKDSAARLVTEQGYAAAQSSTRNGSANPYPAPTKRGEGQFFIHGDADGVRLDHITEMFRLKSGEIHGDLQPRSASRLAILPNTTHVTLMQRMPVIVPMVNDFLDAKPQKQ